MRLERELQKLIENNKKYMVKQPEPIEEILEIAPRNHKPPKMKRIGGGFMPKTM
jgi:hypothetical protein